VVLFPLEARGFSLSKASRLALMRPAQRPSKRELVVLSSDKSDRSINLTTYLHLVPNLQVGRVLPSLPHGSL
jgi:hypothetical protein